MIGEAALPDVVANNAGNPVLHNPLDPLRLVEKGIGIDPFDAYTAQHQEVVQLPEVNGADVGIVHRMVHDLVRMLHQRFEAREIARHQVLDTGIDGKGVRRADVQPAARLEHPAQFAGERPRIMKMLDALDAEDVVKVSVGVRQWIHHVMLAKVNTLVIEHERLGIDVKAMDITVAELEQLLRERAVPCRYIENAPAGRPFKEL